MSRLHTRFGLALLVAAPFALLGPAGCAENNSTIFIRGVLAKNTDCTFTADADSEMIGSGTMDLTFTESYSPFFLIGNQLVPQGDDNQLRTETSRVALNGAEVHLKTVAGDTVQEFSAIVSGMIDPVKGPAAGYGAAQVTLIPPGAVTAPGSFVAELTIFGETLGNKEVETGEFTFPINVCDGCLVFINDDSAAAGTCVPPSGADLRGACLPGQDGLTDCSLALAP